MTTVTVRGIALAVGVLTAPAVWLLWAEHLARAGGRCWPPRGCGGWPPCRRPGASGSPRRGAGRPVAGPPAPDAPPAETPRSPPHRRPPAAGLAEGADGAAAVAVTGRTWPACRWRSWRVLSRTPEGAAALAAEQAGRPGAGARAPEPVPASGDAGEDPAPAPEVERGRAPEAARKGRRRTGEDGRRGRRPGCDGDDRDETPEGQDPPQDPPRAVGPASGPAPPRTVWEAFAWLDQEETEDAGDDDDAA